MKYWLRHLPLEVWVEVFSFPGISHEVLGRIADRFRNHKFVEYLQFFLHDWGKRKLRPVCFFQQDAHMMHIPRTPIPANIKSFECIKISHFGKPTIGLINALDAPENVEEEDDDDNKPSTSEKANNA